MRKAATDYPHDVIESLKRRRYPAAIPTTEAARETAIPTITRAGVATDAVDALARRIEHMVVSGAGVSAADLERSIGRNDLLRVNYLARGTLAARPVCRLRVADVFGGGGMWGTGFLVAPGLLLTNHHVIESTDQALRTVAEFGYEADPSGLLRQGVRFRLRPDLAFVSDVDLDFTIVGIESTSENGTDALSSYGFLRLDPKQHKIEEGDFVTIIQHPNGDEKYLAIRENEVRRIGDAQRRELDMFVWYASDTAPGSSGSPAFNDSWQVVALHHRGVAETREQNGRTEWHLTTGEWVDEQTASRLPDELFVWIANEGIRISRIIDRISRWQTENAQSRSSLLQAFLDDATGVRPFEGTAPRESIVIPTAPAVVAVLEAARPPRRHMRDISYYTGRDGYSPNFLGTAIPLPTLTQRALHFGDVARVRDTNDDVLRYTHFSVVFNATRRLAFLTAVNINGRRWRNLDRGTDKWFYDPRLVDVDLQVGDELYGNEPGPNRNYFDRGHLVRRLDPVWGSLTTAALADEDTFHWTNCSPQYFRFNQGQDLWQGLENFILYNTDEEDVNATVFTGPLFQDDDEEHRGIFIPQFYWKVVVVRDHGGRLYSSAYVVDQRRWARNIPFEELPVGQFNNFQTTIRKLEDRTGIDFGDAVRDAEVLTSPTDVELRSFSDIRHPRR